MTSSLHSVVGFRFKVGAEFLRGCPGHVDAMPYRLLFGSTLNVRRNILCSVSDDQRATAKAPVDSRGRDDGFDGEFASEDTEVYSDFPSSTWKDEENPGLQSNTKRSTPLTARERLKAARLRKRSTDPKVPKTELGSKVLQVLKEGEKGKKRSGLPEAPTNLFDDSKRGLPKPGLTFQFPGGADLFFIIVSFVTISTIMLATTYIVWKSGAIHFNEY